MPPKSPPSSPLDDTRAPSEFGSHADTGVSAGTMILLLFLASLAVGFGALIAAFFILWKDADEWPPADTPPLPAALWLSTVVIILSSGTMHLAVRAAVRDRPTAVARWMVLTLLLAVLFLISQAFNWGLAVAAQMPPQRSLYAALFYLFTGLHAAHIVGGLIPLAVVTLRALRGRYGRARAQGVRWCAYYWHFVDVAWVVMFVVLKLPG
jgi:cytochrome c oxidase subunit 3